MVLKVSAGEQSTTKTEIIFFATMNSGQRHTAPGYYLILNQPRQHSWAEPIQGDVWKYCALILPVVILACLSVVCNTQFPHKLNTNFVF